MVKCMASDSKRLVVIDRPISGTQFGRSSRRAECADNAVNGPPSGLVGLVEEVDYDVL